MPASFWTHYLVALAAVALLLGGLFALARSSSRWRAHAFPNRRFLGVVETFALSPHAQLHVVRAGSRYVLVGVTPHGVALLREFQAEEVTAWLPAQAPSARTTTRAAPASTASRCAVDAGDPT